MREIDWYGNSGRCTPDSGTVEAAVCGVCGKRMRFIRRVCGATGSAEALAGRKHRYDVFECPDFRRGWHTKIHNLKMRAYHAELKNDAHKEKIKHAAEKEIRKLLKKHLKK